MKRIAMAAVLLGAACGGADWREVDDRLAAASGPARAEGYAPLAGPFNDFGAFTDSGGKDWRVTLDTGRYAVGAACTEGCTLTLSISGPDGATLAADSAPADARVARIRVAAGGMHTVRISARCPAGSRCRWASQVYGTGPRGLRPGFAGGER